MFTMLSWPNIKDLWKRKLYYWLSLFFILLRIGVGSWFLFSHVHGVVESKNLVFFT